MNSHKSVHKLKTVVRAQIDHGRCRVCRRHICAGDSYKHFTPRDCSGNYKSKICICDHCNVEALLHDSFSNTWSFLYAREINDPFLDVEKGEDNQHDKFINKTIDMLNSLLDADRLAITSLFDSFRVHCNDKIKDNADLQFTKVPEGHSLGVLGLLNGLLGKHKNGHGEIQAVFEPCCPAHGKRSYYKHNYDICDVCGRTLIPGQIDYFRRTPHEEYTKEG